MMSRLKLSQSAWTSKPANELWKFWRVRPIKLWRAALPAPNQKYANQRQNWDQTGAPTTTTRATRREMGKMATTMTMIMLVLILTRDRTEVLRSIRLVLQLHRLVYASHLHLPWAFPLPPPSRLFSFSVRMLVLMICSIYCSFSWYQSSRLFPMLYWIGMYRIRWITSTTVGAKCWNLCPSS